MGRVMVVMRKAMSVVTGSSPPGAVVPRPSTQAPAHGTHTPTIAPDDPDAAIACSTASCSSVTMSAGSSPVTCSGVRACTASPPVHPLTAIAIATVAASALTARRTCDRPRIDTPDRPFTESMSRPARS